MHRFNILPNIVHSVSHGERRKLLHTYDKSGIVNSEKTRYFNVDETTSTFKLEPIIDSSKPHTFIIYIISAIENFENRAEIRNTWTNPEKIENNVITEFHVVKLFVLGGLELIDKDIASDIETEHTKHRDILTIDALQDTYGALTEKTLYAMQWIHHHCNLNNVDFMMKADDDTLINIYFILNRAQSELHSGHPANFISCFQLPARPCANSGRWKEDPEVFNGNYSAHCQGSSYTFNIQTFHMMIENIPKWPIIRNEDAMLTGLCLKDYNLTVNPLPKDRILPSVDRSTRDTYVQNIQYQGIQGLNNLPRGYNCWVNSSLCLDQLYAMVHAHHVPIRLWGSAFGHMHEEYLLPDVTIKSLIDQQSSRMGR